MITEWQFTQFGILAAIFSWRGAVSPLSSMILTVNVAVKPPETALPLITPSVPSVRFAGRNPSVIDQVTGEVPRRNVSE